MFLPYIAAFGIIFVWIYFLVAMGLIYFFGKFLETRADLDSAKVIGQPKVLAEALRKIGFRRLFPLYKGNLHSRVTAGQNGFVSIRTLQLIIELRTLKA